MLLSLAQWLQTLGPEFGFLRVVQYLTFRAVMAAMTALIVGLVAGPFFIRRLTALKIAKAHEVDFHRFIFDDTCELPTLSTSA